MQYFDIPTIKAAIENLQDINANWLLPSFVFAANDVKVGELVDLSERLGTDQFLDRYFNGKRLDLPSLPNGNNLLRPRLKNIKWDSGKYANDYMIRQDTKMWGNLFSSRGYREMRLQGLIEGEKAITGLTDAYQPRFEAEIPASFRFEDFMVWLFAFEGIPDDVSSWVELFNYLVTDQLGLQAIDAAYQGRFRISTPAVPWPTLLPTRPSNEEFIAELAPKLDALMKAGPSEQTKDDNEQDPALSDDDAVYSAVLAAITSKESLSFLLAGPPGTGKTRYARRLALKIAESEASRILFLQFHPAIGYDDFVEGFRPAPSDSGSGIRYELSPRIFLNFAKQAALQPEKKFVAVIDELNRGDVARIFGEVLTYLEPDYRNTEFTLPFSSEKAVLPPNLITIATANPFDRSVTDLDEALLRRFWVIELNPDAAVLKSHLTANDVEKAVLNRTLRVFEILNGAMPNGFGHTSFLKVRTIDDLASVWIGRARLTLRRALVHDRSAFDAATTEIEGLFASSDDEAVQAPDATSNS